MPVPLRQVDAFTAEPYAGNPAAVCLLDEAAPEGWMQLVAREMNLSETAFVHPREADDGPAWRLRWFTPTTEVDLCGHATLATAHVLFEEGEADAGEPLAFETNDHELTCYREEDGWIRMDFPATPPYQTKGPGGLEEILGAEPSDVRETGLDLLVEFEDAEGVRGLEPDLDAITELPYRGLIATAPAGEDSDADFVSRFFAPKVGVPEDPVTGSAHCALGPLWAAKLRKDEVLGHQVSERGGYVRIRSGKDRVDLIGQAVTVFEGELAKAAGPR